MSWYKFTLTSDQVANYENVSLVSNFPIGLPLFREVSERRSGPETYYLPPDAVPYCDDLIARYNGVPCDKPDRSRVEIVTGSDEDYALLD
jgi:hypothetical protein